jgi:hypothetical protein
MDLSRLPGLEVRELNTGDIDELAIFLAEQTGTAQNVLRNRLRWLARNPAITPEVPFGGGAYRNQKLCGATVYVPMRFSNGVNTRTCILQILFYVGAEGRGAGLPLFLAFRSLANRYPLYASTANTESAPFWQRLGGKPVAGSEFEYVRVCRLLPVATEWVLRALRYTGRSRSEDETRNQECCGMDRLAAVRDPESALQAIVQAKSESYSFVRDAATIRWKFYEAGETLYKYEGRDSKCLCAFRVSRRGVQAQIVALEMLDVWGRLDPADHADFLSCVKRAFKPDIITVRGGSLLSKPQGLLGKFQRRQLPACAVWLMDPRGFLENRFEYSAIAGE